MTTTKRLTTLALAAMLAAPLAATAPVMAADPAGSASTAPRLVDPGPSTLLPLVRVPGPTGGILWPPGPPNFADGTPPPTDDDWALDHILLGADDLLYPHDVCYGMITCCNSEWVQGCDGFENVCNVYDGVVQTVLFSDGSTQYECHEAE